MLRTVARDYEGRVQIFCVLGISLRVVMAQPAAPAGGAAAAAARAVRPAVMPEAFDGETDWTEYLLYFEQCANVNGWADPVKAQFLGVRLRGLAQRYYATIPQARRIVWAHACADMAQRFAPDANERQYKAQFKARRRQPAEAIAHLADDLRRLVARGYPRMNAGDQQELVRDQFIDALTPISLRVRLQENPPANIQEAVEAALHLERVWASVDATSGHTAGKLVGLYPDEGAAKGSELVPVMAVQSPPTYQGRGQGRDTAFNAGQTETTAAVSISRLAEEVSQLSARLESVLRRDDGRSSSRTREPFSCYSCGRPGHIARNCPSSTRRDAERHFPEERSFRSVSKQSGNGR